MLCFSCVIPLLRNVLFYGRHIFACTLGLLVACAYVPGVKAVFQVVPVPLLAIFLSPFYLPLLIQAYEHDGRVHSYLYYVASSVLFYCAAAVVGLAGWWIWLYAPYIVSLVFVMLIVFLAPCIAFLLTCMPFIMFGYSYDPMVVRPPREVWRHGILMTVYELPFIIMLFVYLAPFGFLIYQGPSLLCKLGYIGPALQRVAMHVGSVLYWQVGWAVMIVFYQEHKLVYASLVEDKDLL